MFIFPLTQLVLRPMGRPTSLASGHPMNPLAMQVALTLPLSLPLIVAATACHINWFCPASMIAVGAHYLPFIFLYGMWQFGVLAGMLFVAGVGMGLFLPSSFVAGGWFTTAVLLVFAFVGRRVATSE